MYILFVYILLKLVSHYDLSVLSMSVMGLQKTTKVWIPYSGIFLDFLNFLKLCKALNEYVKGYII